MNIKKIILLPIVALSLTFSSLCIFAIDSYNVQLADKSEVISAKKVTPSLQPVKGGVVRKAPVKDMRLVKGETARKLPVGRHKLGMIKSCKARCHVVNHHRHCKKICVSKVKKM